MPLNFDNGTLRFMYPETWQVERQETEEGWTVAVQSPGTAFLLISSYEERPAVKEVLDTTLATLRQDYAELDAQPATEKIAQHQADGFDVDFFSLDTVNSCVIRSFRTRASTYLILSQSSGLEDETTAAVLQAIRVSLKIED
jgi:hypothetical protein